MSHNDKLVKIIKDVALEQGYEITESKTGFEVYTDRYNAVSFLVIENSSGYLEVHQWEYIDKEKNGRYGRAVYSLRLVSDVVQFCSIMITSFAIRAKRRYDLSES